jgi:hypothetical protein
MKPSGGPSSGISSRAYLRIFVPLQPRTRHALAVAGCVTVQVSKRQSFWVVTLGVKLGRTLCY